MTNPDPRPGAAHPKLPLLNTIVMSYSAYFHHLPDVLRICWLWLVVCAPVLGLASWLQWSRFARLTADMRPGAPPQMPAQAEPAASLLLEHGSTLVFMLAGVSIAVAWHRRFILGEQPGWSAANIATKSVWRYVGSGLGIFLTAAPFMAMIAAMFVLQHFATAGDPAHPSPWLFAVIPVNFVLLPAMIAVVLRLILILPARAVGRLDAGKTNRDFDDSGAR